jgi:hypothetical protein
MILYRTKGKSIQFYNLPLHKKDKRAQVDHL